MTTFTVKSDWSILVLEDTPERIAWFKQRFPEAVYCATADADRPSREAVIFAVDQLWIRQNKKQ